MKQSIKVIDKDFNFLGEIDNYKSLIFIRRFFKAGDFELHIPFSDYCNLECLKEDNIIFLGNDLHKNGIIEHINLLTTEEGDELIIKGSTLQGILKRRLIIPPPKMSFAIATGTQEDIIKQFVKENIKESNNKFRKIENFYIGANKKRGKQDAWRSRYDNLLEKVSEVCEYSNLGMNVSINITHNMFVFDVQEGRDLTTDQEKNPPVIFSIDFDNIRNKNYIKSLLNFKNVGYLGGNGDEEDRLIQEIGEYEGLNRSEVFIDCSGVEYVEELRKIGKHKLEDYKTIESFEADIIPYGSFNYEEDFDLGDIVTISDKKWEIILNSRIIEIKEIYETGGFTIQCTFGSNIPNFIDKINLRTKKEVR